MEEDPANWPEMEDIINECYGTHIPKWCRLLLDPGSELPYDGTPKIWWPIREAPTMEMLRSFLTLYQEKQVDLNGRNGRGKPLINYLLIKRALNIDVLKALIEFGVNPLADDSENISILFQAFLCDAPPDLIEYMIDNITGLDYNKETIYGRTLLEVVVATTESVSVIKKLLEKGAQPRSGSDGGTILHWVCEYLINEDASYQELNQLAVSLRDRIVIESYIPLTLLLKFYERFCPDQRVLDSRVFAALIPSEDLPHMSSLSKGNILYHLAASNLKNGPDLLQKLADAGFNFTSEAIDIIIESIHNLANWIPKVMQFGARVTADQLTLAVMKNYFLEFLPQMIENVEGDLLESNPGIACKLSCSLTAPEVDEDAVYESLKLLFDQHNIDVNYSHDSFPVLFSLTKTNRHQLAQKLLEEYPQFDVNINFPVSVYLKKSFDPYIQHLSTPLKYALVKYYYEMAIVLVKNFAKLPAQINISELRHPSSLLHFCLILSYTGNQFLVIERIFDELKRNLKEPEKLEKTSLFDISLRAFQIYIRGHVLTRKKICQFISSLPRTRIREFIKLNHIDVQGLEFNEDFTEMHVEMHLEDAVIEGDDHVDHESDISEADDYDYSSDDIGSLYSIERDPEFYYPFRDTWRTFDS